MGDEPDDHNTLLRAIGAMRDEVDAVIGEELDRLRVGRPVPMRSAGPTRVLEVGGEAEVERPRPRATESEREASEFQPWDGPRFHAVDPGPATSQAAREMEAEGEDSGEAERRLDALALRLEGRLRRTRERETHRHHPSEGGGPGSGPEVVGEPSR